MALAPGTTLKDWSKALTANSTAAAFTAKAPTATKPSGTSTGIFDVSSSSTVPSNIIICPYGTDTDNDVFGVRLWGWNWVPDLSYWFPYKLLEISVTLGSQAAVFAASTFLVDTITITHGNFTAVSPADNTSAFVFGKLHGAQVIEFDWDLGAGAATMNALFRTYDPAQ